MASEKSDHLLRMAVGDGSGKLKSESNYYAWVHMMEFQLEERDLYEVVLGLDVPDDEFLETDTREYERKQRKAFNLIKASIERNLFYLLNECTQKTGTALWNLLKAKFGSPSKDFTFQLHLDYCNVKLEEGEPVAQFLDRVQDLRTGLANVGLHLKDEEVVVHTLAKLRGGKFIPCVYNILYRERRPSFFSLRQILIDHEKKLEVNGAFEFDKPARFSAKNQSSEIPQPQKAGNTKKVRCGYCKKRGHTYGDCRKRIGACQ